MSAGVQCRCPCTCRRFLPQDGGVPSTCCSSASVFLVSWQLPASTMVQSGLTGDGGCLWEWLLFLLSSLDLEPSPCQTHPTRLCSVERWSKGVRSWRVTEVSHGAALLVGVIKCLALLSSLLWHSCQCPQSALCCLFLKCMYHGL